MEHRIQVAPEEEARILEGLGIGVEQEATVDAKTTTMPFPLLVAATLNAHYTWNRILEFYANSEDRSKEAIRNFVRYLPGQVVESLKPLIYWHDTFLYKRIWDKPPSKTCLKKGLDLIYQNI
jgi:hypothetical protein